ncbi:MAG: AraC family transcriptional regulator [Deltaproteobacteria bacterium]|nr:AraC family transcriptional regulator [Deltaproteobacteria bacterium]
MTPCEPVVSSSTTGARRSRTSRSPRSSWTLARRLQRVCGLSPSRFVQQLRAEEASRRLARGARFDETAYAVGFSDPSALRRMLGRLEAGGR